MKRIIDLGLVLVIGVGLWFAKDHLPLGSQHGTAHTQGTQYQCPMHPAFVSDQPGTCAICGMSLAAVQDEQQLSADTGLAPSVDGYATVHLKTQRQQLIGVKTSLVETKDLFRTIRTVGWIAYDPNLYHAQEEYLAAMRGFAKMRQSTLPEIRGRAEKLVASARMRLRLQGLSDEQIEQMAKQKKPDASLLLGDVSDKIWLYAAIYEYELGLVGRGDLVDVTVKAFPGEVFEGKVQSIDSVLDPATRSARVRVLIPNPAGKLKPQMFANARIHVSLGKHLSIPRSAVLDTGKRVVVFVEEAKGKFSPREVRLGHRAEEDVAVLSGLNEGERIVTSGNFLMDSESKLRAARQATRGGHQH